jgi:hypothetical protein
LGTQQQAAKVAAKAIQDSKQHEPGEEAMKFLQACLEDLELERLMAATQQTDAFSPRYHIDTETCIGIVIAFTCVQPGVSLFFMYAKEQSVWHSQCEGLQPCPTSYITRRSCF